MDDSRQELKAIQDYLKRVFYVYQHYNNQPERGELGCRYIGKGKKNRAYQIGRNAHWAAIFSRKFRPEVLFIAENLTEEEAFEIEKWMIANARAAGVKLCNMTDGGEGVSLTEEHERSRIEGLKAAWARPETRAKHMETNAKPETRAERSRILKEAYSRPEIRAKTSAAAKASNARPEVKAKISAAMKLTLSDPAWKARRAATEARPEVKARRSEIAKEFFRKKKQEKENTTQNTTQDVLSNIFY